MIASVVVFLGILAAAFAGTENGPDAYVVGPVSLAPTNYQNWAHLHWAWLKNSDGSQSNVLDLVAGYKNNSIPLGAVNIDSTWATQYNNFEIDTTRFPDFAGLVKELHDQGLKVILWYALLSFCHVLFIFSLVTDFIFQGDFHG